MGILDSIPIPTGLNPGVRAAKQQTMLSLLGNPRGSYSQACQAIEHPVLHALLETRSVGPFRVSGLKPAVDALERIFADVRSERGDIHAKLGTAGMLCARLVRGSTTAISNHSWGTAIDLTLAGVLDRRGDQRVQQGLADIAPIFNRHGWFWGAGFGTEDAMHFEVGDDKIREWHAQGVFGLGRPLAPAGLSLGDRGPEVRELQELLNRAGHDLKTDGGFGPKTFDAVRSFQQAAGLTVNGVAGPETLSALRGSSPPSPRAGGQLLTGTLSVGDTGHEVRALQEQLNVLGFGLKVDGIFGRGLLAAVMAFQSAQGLAADGVVGRTTRERLAQMRL